jgi:hypothetical protein
MPRRSRRLRRLAGGTALATLLGFATVGAIGASVSTAPAGRAQPAAGVGQATPTQNKPAKKDPVAKTAEPWPDAEKLAARRAEAEHLPLFGGDAALPFTLTADFSAVNRDRNPESSKRFPGVLEVQAEGGKAVSLPLQLGSRGHVRLDARTCSVVPLRLEFTKKDVKGTVFEGQRDLKLVTHCENDNVYEQYVLTEYLAYRLFGLFTPRSFRARLVRVTYLDPARKKTLAPRYGILVEQDEDVARRLGGRVVPVKQRLFRMLDQESLTLMAILQYIVGNTDYSIYALHNVRLVQDQAGTLYPITYDFDYSGLVNAHYAVPDRRLGLNSVRDRLYRGPCRTLAELEPLLAKFLAKRTEMLALVDAIPDMEPGRRKDAKKYLEEFLSLAGNPARVKRVLVDGCVAAPGM